MPSTHFFSWGGGAGPVLAWILATGFWDDGGQWIDSDFWID